MQVSYVNFFTSCGCHRLLVRRRPTFKQEDHRSLLSMSWLSELQCTEAAMSSIKIIIPEGALLLRVGKS